MDFQVWKTRFIAQVDAKPAIKYILLVQICSLFLSLISPISNLLVLVPSDLLHLHLWRVVTNLFVENNLIVIAWSTYCLHQFLMYIQPNWPIDESGKYSIIVQLFSNFSLVFTSLFLYIFAGIVYSFYEAQIYGIAPLAMAALIALKQFLPDTVLLATPFGRLKNGHLPMASIAASFLFWLFGLLRGTAPFQLMFSMQISWTYLRFFQSRGGIGESMIGDRSEHFSWASLFPRRFQSAATLIGRLTFRLLHRLGLLRRMIRREHMDMLEEQNLEMDALDAVKVETAGAAVSAPESWDAERKRQKALRMLNERLAAQQKQQQKRQPTHDGEREKHHQEHLKEAQDPAAHVMEKEEMNNGTSTNRTETEVVQFYLDNQRSSSEREQSQPPFTQMQ